MTILEQLAEHTKERYEKRIGEKPLSLVKAQALAVQKGTFAFEKALSKKRLAFICEVKKASPSKGLISADFPYLAIARQYEAAGADCISCLTEPKWFLGSDEYLQEIAKTVQIPILRKDFTVCDYQIYEAKLLGVGAVLLICALLSKQELEEYIDICDALGMSALVVDTSNAARLRALVPPGVLFVSESGVKTRSDIEKIEKSGANAVLIGETLMKSANIGEKLRELRGC